MSRRFWAGILALLQFNVFGFFPVFNRALSPPYSGGDLECKSVLLSMSDAKKGKEGTFLGAGTISDRTRAYFEAMDTVSGQAMGAGGSSSLVGLERLDESWARLRGGGLVQPS